MSQEERDWLNWLRPAVVAVDSPKASAPGIHQRICGSSSWNSAPNPWRLRPCSPRLQPSTKKSSASNPDHRGFGADFFGDIPVASAFGVHAGPDAGVADPDYTLGALSGRPEPGTFYLPERELFTLP
jgi:hypothetical protein